ncbi:hypothetical protein [Streptomyces sp. NPDC046925]|uniref:hypothetical protein n=1 Tax=Streptomyces sp. NPDC046925 TaxID=3155375 RepID=UPI0033CAD5F5
MWLAAQGLDPLGPGLGEDGMGAHPNRPAMVADGAGKGGDGLQPVAADRLAVAHTHRPFGGALLEPSGHDRTQQRGEDGEGGADEGG